MAKLSGAMGVTTWQYDGEVSLGQPNGKGKMIFSDGDVVEGSFINGTPNGHCSYTYANGDEYRGSLVNGKRDGYGIYTHADGFQEIGMWERNEFIG